MTVSINGKNLKATYGIQLAEHAEDSLFTPAPMKEALSVKSSSENGKYIQKSYHKVDERSFSLTFYLFAVDYEDYMVKYNNFINELQSTALLKFTVVKGNVTTIFHVSYVAATSYSHFNGKWGKINVKFNEPDPTNHNQDD